MLQLLGRGTLVYLKTLCSLWEMLENYGKNFFVFVIVLSCVWKCSKHLEHFVIYLFVIQVGIDSCKNIVSYTLLLMRQKQKRNLISSVQ